MNKHFFERLRILVIDDEQLMRDLIRTILKSLGVRDVITVGDAAAAFDELRNGQLFDIVTCDYSMKPISGTEFAYALRRDKTHRSRQIPIVMLTASTDSDVVREAMQAGVNDYVTKPISAASLGARVSGVINRPRSFVETPNYIGPERRRSKRDEGSGGPRRRKSDAQAQPHSNVVPELGVED